MADPVPFKLPTSTELASFAAGLADALGPVHTTLPHPGGDGTLLVLRAGFTAQKVEGPREGHRLHAFEDFDSFAAWLVRHADPAKAEILVDTALASASLDSAHPHSDVVTCPLHQHPRFARWAERLGKSLTQAEFHRFIVSCPEDFAPATSSKGESLGSYGPFLAGQVGKLRLGIDSSYEVELDDRGFAKFTSANGKTTLSGELPPRFGLFVPMFLGIRNEFDAEICYPLELHLRVVPSRDEPPAFVLTCPQLEVIRREARLDAVAHLRRGLGASFLVGLGKLVTGHRPALPQ